MLWVLNIFIIKYKLNDGSGINQYSLTNEGKCFITWHQRTLYVIKWLTYFQLGKHLEKCFLQRWVVSVV